MIVPSRKSQLVTIRTSSDGGVTPTMLPSGPVVWNFLPARGLTPDWVFLSRSNSSSARRPKSPTTTDILLRHGALVGSTPPEIPGGNTAFDKSDVRFNVCGTTSADPYEVLVHEAGHVLGIRDGESPAPVDDIHHPPIPDSVMNYIDEPDCSPHPFDIMAIYALYQLDL